MFRNCYGFIRCAIIASVASRHYVKFSGMPEPGVLMVLMTKTMKAKLVVDKEGSPVSEATFTQKIALGTDVQPNYRFSCGSSRTNKQGRACFWNVLGM